MSLSANEMILALRGNDAQWLAALVNALEEALRDPAFHAQHREIVRQLLDVGIVPNSVARAADERFRRFETSFGDLPLSEPIEEFPAAAMAGNGRGRPKLTLVDNSAA
jgi:hypothetical protein